MSVGMIIYTRNKAADATKVLEYIALIPEFTGKEAQVRYQFSSRKMDETDALWRTAIRVDDEAGVITSDDVFLFCICGEIPDEFSKRRLDKMFSEDYKTNILPNLRPQEVTSWSYQLSDHEWGLVKCARLKGAVTEVLYESIALDNRSLMRPL